MCGYSAVIAAIAQLRQYISDFFGNTALAHRLLKEYDALIALYLVTKVVLQREYLCQLQDITVYPLGFQLLLSFIGFVV